jgi:hypothetical protein
MLLEMLVVLYSVIQPKEIWCWTGLFGIILGKVEGELGVSGTDFVEFFILSNVPLSLGSFL